MDDINIKLEKFLDAISESIISNTEESKEFLKEEGIDPDGVHQKGRLLARKLSARAKVEIAKKNRAEVLSKAKQELKDLPKEKIINLRERVAQILAGKTELDFQMQFNKLKEVKEEDLADMLSESQLLQIIEQLKIENNEK